MTGVIVINKEKGISSSGVVVKIKKIVNDKKVGHLGTLDPLATGVLPICIGRATRLFDYFLKKQKTYIAQFEFGKQTDTLDLEGQVEKTCENIPDEKEINEAIKNNFSGKILQLPPMYSSKKINGQKAYDLARQGKSVELKPVEVEIFKFDLLRQISNSVFEFEIVCSSGTYIRSLARDLGIKTNSCATMVNLIRTKTGNFDIKKAIYLKDLDYQKIENNILSLEEVLCDFEKIDITDEEYTKLRNGIKIEKNTTKTSDKDYVVVLKDKVVGMGKVENNKLKIATYFV